MKKILLNPGPTNTLSCVKEAQTFNSDICHRTDDFSELLEETKQNLLTRFSKNVNLNEWNVTIFGGSGTAAMEALISTLINQTSVIIAGKYGQRSSEMMDLYNIETEKIFCNNIKELKINKQYKTVYFVENETTTGEKFDLKNMSRLYPNCKFFIDATSAFGATDYEKYLDKINALSFCSNKCLQSTPGLGIVIWRKDLKTYNKNYYLNLNKYVNKMPFTLPVQSIAALNKSLKSSIMSEETYNRRKNKLISDFMAIGIECINKEPSNSVIGFIHPCRDYNSLKSFLKSKNIIIYDGIDGIKNSFRVATMSVLFEREYDYILRCFNDSCIR